MLRDGKGYNIKRRRGIKCLEMERDIIHIKRRRGIKC